MNAELIKALRWCGSEDERHEMCVDESYRCPMWNEDRITDDCKAELMRDAADALEELQDDWVYCSDLLNIAIRTTGISMTALVKLYEIECADRERSKHDEHADC